MKRTPHNKIVFTDEMKQFLKDNYQHMTNKQLAEALGLKLSRTRAELYSMGLKRMELRKWTESEVEYLKSNYRTKGDKEIGEHLGRTNKMVCKKRGYLNLKRNAKDILFIRRRNNKIYSHGYQKGQQPMGTRKEGEEWQRPGCSLGTWYIKYNGEVRRKAHVVWEQHNGIIPKGMVVRHKGSMDDDSIENLMLISKSENVKINTQVDCEEKKRLKSAKISSSHHRRKAESDIDMILMGYVPSVLSDGTEVWA